MRIQWKNAFPLGRSVGTSLRYLHSGRHTEAARRSVCAPCCAVWYTGELFAAVRVVALFVSWGVHADAVNGVLFIT